MADEEKCPHKTYKATAKIQSVVVTELNIKQLVVVLKVTCALCKESFIFKGPTGFSTSQPLASPDGQELRIPIDWPVDPKELDVEPETGITH